jgi:hypothetical protein
MKTMLQNLALVCLYVILSINSVHSGTIDPNTPDEKYINYGKDFECIYKICGTYKDDKLFCASAVVIEPRWILTASHVVNNARTCLIHQGDKAFIVDKIIIHEDFKESVFGHNDIALCHTDKDVVLNFYPALYDKDDEVGKTCSIAGYGLTGTFLTGTKSSDGLKRAGSNCIDHIDRSLLICSPSRTHNKTELEFIIGSGDSGGGLFIDNKLAGINSCVIADDKKPDSNYGDESGHTRVSKYIQWIRKKIEQNK